MLKSKYLAFPQINSRGRAVEKFQRMENFKKFQEGKIKNFQIKMEYCEKI